jgi:hypothetical protein
MGGSSAGSRRRYILAQRGPRVDAQAGQSRIGSRRDQEGTERMGATRPADELGEELAEPAPPKPFRWWLDATMIAALLPLAIVARRPGECGA